MPSCSGLCFLFSGSVHSHLGHPCPTQLDALGRRGALLRHQRDQLEPERTLPAVRRRRRNSQSVGPATVQGANVRLLPRDGSWFASTGQSFGLSMNVAPLDDLAGTQRKNSPTQTVKSAVLFYCVTPLQYNYGHSHPECWMTLNSPMKDTNQRFYLDQV